MTDGTYELDYRLWRMPANPERVTRVDVVVVSYNSRDRIRACVEPLLAQPGTRVVVVDNASPDRTLEALEGLAVSKIQTGRNAGFAHGCNVGWRAGSAPYVLLLNPDARIDSDSLARLTAVLDDHAEVGAAAPKIVDGEGHVDLSQRRFARLSSTWARAFFLHRVFPRAGWADELVHDPSAYERPGAPDWVSGACVLLRRTALKRLRGLDERFFMYREDMDLCRRLRDEGWEIRYEPAAVVRHEGGASAPRASLFPVLAESRIRYARKHRGRAARELERAGVAAEALTHAVVSAGGLERRRGHARALVRALKT